MSNSNRISRIRLNRDHNFTAIDPIRKGAIIRLRQIRGWRNWKECGGHKPFLKSIVVLNTATGYAIGELLKISFSRRFVKMRLGGSQQIVYISFGKILNLHSILEVSKNNVSVDPYGALEACQSSI